MTRTDYLTTNLYIVLVNVHGLIRGNNPEYGRDADTGGQVRYVLELAQALSTCHRVGRIDILTRQVVEDGLSTDYATPTEPLTHNVHIIRLACGPLGYLRKELLWLYLPEFTNAALDYLLSMSHRPSIVHSHYADAGLVGSILAKKLDIPHLHTSHSLGRVKQLKLQEAGITLSEIETHYNISQRIKAEEQTFKSADLIFASTTQEVEEQYSLYRALALRPEPVVVNPPGVDTHQFRPCQSSAPLTVARKLIKTKLEHPHKPMILAMARPDERKNLSSLLQAYGDEPKLSAIANLVIVSGQTDRHFDSSLQPSVVLNNLNTLVESYRLGGKVALLKFIDSEAIAQIYQLAFQTRGVFVNPALTEPFGLSLLEATATGLPIVATWDAGPKGIIESCQNGLLIDPLNTVDIAQAIWHILSKREVWCNYSTNGLRAISQHFSWHNHVQRYIFYVLDLLHERQEKGVVQKRGILGNKCR